MKTVLITIKDDKNSSVGGVFKKRISALEMENHQTVPRGILVDVDGNVSVIISQEFIEYAHEVLSK